LGDGDDDQGDEEFQPVASWPTRCERDAKSNMLASRFATAGHLMRW
jgi:hypothetical protein